jgi:hypothetical protein
MIRSIFDPTGPDTERSGSQNLGPSAFDLSHMPVALMDGEADDFDVIDLDGPFDDAQTVPADPAEALAAMVFDIQTVPAVAPAAAPTALFDDELLSPIGVEHAVCPEGAD